jgi:hypothetical protein
MGLTRKSSRFIPLNVYNIVKYVSSYILLFNILHEFNQHLIVPHLLLQDLLCLRVSIAVREVDLELIDLRDRILEYDLIELVVREGFTNQLQVFLVDCDDVIKV